jgi:hypothetical protein
MCAQEHHDHSSAHSRRCSGCCGTRFSELSRRQFIAGTGAVALGSVFMHHLQGRTAFADTVPRRILKQDRPLRIQPVLTCSLPRYSEATSWRPWGGLLTDSHVREECAKIQDELNAMAAKADFPLELLPLKTVQSAEEGRSIAAEDHDGTLIFGAAGGTDVIISLADPKKHNLLFVRHKSGPVYLWFEIADPRFLRQESDFPKGTGGMDHNDVIVDDFDEILWRLRALHGLKNIRNKRIVVIGNAIGWDRGTASDSPKRAQELWGLDYREIPYTEMGERIRAARANDALVRQCRDMTEAYLRQPGVTLLPRQQQLTTRELIAGAGSSDTLQEMRVFTEKAFLLTEVFRDLMEEHETDALTVSECMGTIISMSETTACLCLTLLNDEGCMAFCESDFAVIPSGILLHYICCKPVFLCNPTFPHNNMITVAHCTAPRKMDGVNAENMFVRTHFESDYGAAPKINFKLGQNMTILAPDFASRRWMGFEGMVLENPELDICTSQVDLRINGDCDRLLHEKAGFHVMACYDNYLREVGYALHKAGVEWVNLSA